MNGQPDTAPYRMALRPFPAPFRAMVAISTDIDQTRIDVLRETHRFMNTCEETALGPGLGLDIANSLWMYKGPHHDPFRDNLAYFADYGWERRSPYAEELMHYARSGWIDTLHSYGNFNLLRSTPCRFTREHAAHALDILEYAGVALRVWVNHGGRNNRQNIGDKEWQEGDDPGSDAYHADLLRGYGAEYLWLNAGADRLGSAAIVSPVELRDGSLMFGFPRLTTVRDCPPAPQIGPLRGLNWGQTPTRAWLHAWLPQALAYQLSETVLDTLVEHNHSCVFAQHLGAIAPMTGFDREMAAALARLRRYQDEGVILVARTSRLLHYNRVRDHLRFRAVAAGPSLAIDIEAVYDPVRGRWVPGIEDLRGITFEITPDIPGVGPTPVTLSVAGTPVPANEIAAGAGNTIGIRWFAPDTSDYAAPFLAAERRSYLVWNAAARARADQAGAAAAAAIAAASAAPEGLDPARYDALRVAVPRYQTGFAAAVRAFEHIGFVEYRAGLEFGSGTGEWSLAFLQHCAHVTAVEPSPAAIAVARLAARQLDRADRVEFVEAALATAELGRGRFDCVWCRDALCQLELEPVLARIGNALADGRPFYCCYPGEAQLVYDAELGLAGAEPRAALAPLGDLLAGHLRRCGLFRVPGSPRRLATPDELLRACRAAGFGYVGTPGLGHSGGPGLGLQRGFDLLLRKTAAPADARARMLAADAETNLPFADLERLAASGCPRLVCDMLQARDPELRDPNTCDLYVRALIRAGLVASAAVRRLCEARPQRVSPLTLGLYWHECGDYARAVKCYRQLAAAEPGRDFLIGCCRLQQGRVAAAVRRFERAVARADAGMREWAGVTAAHLRRGDIAAARRAFFPLDKSPRQSAAAQWLRPLA